MYYFSEKKTKLSLIDRLTNRQAGRQTHGQKLLPIEATHW